MPKARAGDRLNHYNTALHVALLGLNILMLPRLWLQKMLLIMHHATVYQLVPLPSLSWLQDSPHFLPSSLSAQQLCVVPHPFLACTIYPRSRFPPSRPEVSATQFYPRSKNLVFLKTTSWPFSASSNLKAGALNIVLYYIWNLLDSEVHGVETLPSPPLKAGLLPLIWSKALKGFCKMQTGRRWCSICQNSPYSFSFAAIAHASCHLFTKTELLLHCKLS